ncbi:flagellar motor switch protein FliN [Cellulomonas citrea]|uniref:flagellar motor switch protein FliN n=1 Tax=Cellulomonas citrea TaxID=1909423 RepID=UPI00135C5FD6|nr:flagellar motor switch protein FliN [Cellulomonas citrea]
MNPPTATADLTQAAADAAAALVPATSPLVAVRAPAGATPPPGSQAVVASLVGATSAELALVADAVVADAVAAGSAGGAPIALADALRPALEAAAAALGAGVLENARTEQVAHVVGADTEVFALQADGQDVAWFTVRLRGSQVSGPQASVQPGSMRVLYDVEMTLTAELGRTRLPLRQVLELAPGAVLELDRTAGSPADVMVNGRLIARGEVVVVDEDYGLRITEIVAGPETEL